MLAGETYLRVIIVHGARVVPGHGARGGDSRAGCRELEGVASGGEETGHGAKEGVDDGRMSICVCGRLWRQWATTAGI